jgi:hypothetical protein
VTLAEILCGDLAQEDKTLFHIVEGCFLELEASYVPRKDSRKPPTINLHGRMGPTISVIMEYKNGTKSDPLGSHEVPHVEYCVLG